MTREEAIETFRKEENPETALVLTGRDVATVSLRKVLLAWDKVPVTMGKAKATFKAGDGLWEELWEGVGIDLSKLSAVTGLRKAGYFVNMLKGYRLIYPDGTIATIGQKVLRIMAKAELGL